MTKVKKERAPRNSLANIPGHLKGLYITEFQPAFIHVAITISVFPWGRLPDEDVQELFSEIFPEVTHKIVFGDMFYSPVTYHFSIRSPILTKPSRLNNWQALCGIGSRSPHS